MNSNQKKLDIYNNGEELGGESGSKKEKISSFNGLDVQSWMKFTKSWFICNPPPRSQERLKHPAKFPEDLVRDFVSFFTKNGEIVLDPFAGVGSAVVASSSINRKGVGIELSREFYNISTNSLPLFDKTELYILGDARNSVSLCNSIGIDKVHYIITSPPYWNMLKQSRGGVLSAQKGRKNAGLHTEYHAGESDLGIIEDYDTFIGELVKIFMSLRQLLLPNRYLTVVLQNVRVPEGEVKTLAWDFTRELSNHYTFKGERIWLQDNKKLGVWGWPSEFVTNVHHHYCLNFKNDKL
jgi:DNA modification methylase